MLKEFDKIIGYDAIKLELDRICDYMVNPDKYKKLGVNMSRGILFYGEPGVGKTLMANCLIEASKRKVFTCRKTKPDGEFVNEIRNTFESAKENAPSIVFLDDMDKFANEDVRHSDTEEYVTIQSCIDECKNSEVFVVATVNDKNKLPHSLLRVGRFDKKLKINNPEGKDAEEIIKYYLNQKNYIADIDYKLVARILSGGTCAELETVVNEAGYYAGYDNKDKIDTNDLIRACLRVIFKAPESLSESALNDIERTAYHEAGHAVINEVFNPNSVTLVSVCKYDGDIEGFASTTRKDEYWTYKKCMEEHVISLLGGKAATELKFAEADIGCNSDIHRVFRIVERFVDNYCTYGFNMFEFQSSSSNDLLRRREDMIFSEIDRYYRIAKKILNDNMEFVDKLAKALVKDKTLIQNEVQKIKSTCTIVPYSL